MTTRRIWHCGLTKAYVEYRLECMHNALERMKDVACKCGGPAVIEIFGAGAVCSGFKEGGCAL